MNKKGYTSTYFIANSIYCTKHNAFPETAPRRGNLNFIFLHTNLPAERTHTKRLFGRISRTLNPAAAAAAWNEKDHQNIRLFPSFLYPVL